MDFYCEEKEGENEIVKEWKSKSEKGILNGWIRMESGEWRDKKK